MLIRYKCVHGQQNHTKSSQNSLQVGLLRHRLYPNFLNNLEGEKTLAMVLTMNLASGLCAERVQQLMGCEVWLINMVETEM